MLPPGVGGNKCMKVYNYCIYELSSKTIYYFSNKRTVGATLLKVGEYVDTGPAIIFECLEIFWGVLKNFGGNQKAPISIIMKKEAGNRQMVTKLYYDEKPTVSECCMLFEVCDYCIRQLSSKTICYFSNKRTVGPMMLKFGEYVARGHAAFLDILKFFGCTEKF